MPVFPVTFNEKKRSRFGRFVAFSEVALVVVALVVGGGGVFLMKKIEAYVWLLKGYATGPLPNMLISVGSIAVIINGFGAKICYDCSRYEKRYRFENLLKIHIVVIFLFLWIVLSSSIMCEVHDQILRTSFHQGFTSAIGFYKETPKVKQTIDLLQINFRCCGSANYTDWFHVPWIQLHLFANKKQKNAHQVTATRLVNGEALLHGVPFSCCRVDSAGPCDHYHFKNKSENEARDLIYVDGCNEFLMNEFEILLDVLAKIQWAMLIAEFVLMIFIRYLQTAIDNSYVFGDPKGENPAWLFERCPCSCIDEYQPLDKPNSKRNQLEVEEK